jgi:arylformamidase
MVFKVQKPNHKSQAWRSWPLAQLEREYSPSSCVPSLSALLAEYATASRVAEQRLNCKKDLNWGERADETLDFFPADSADAPLLVFFHGGYWQELSKNESLFAAPDCVAHGIAYAAINYALAPLARVDTIVDHCPRAIAWLLGHAGALGFDPRRLFVAGSSAGAHLAAMLLVSGWQRETGLSDRAISGAILLSGIYDLEPLIPTYVNAPLHLSLADAEKLSPMALLLGLPKPTIVAWGENETGEFKRQSRNYASRLRAAGFEVTTLEAVGRNHFDIVFDLANPESELGRATLALVEGTQSG